MEKPDVKVMGPVDLVVVGAGIYGLSSAATYRRLHPQASVLVVEESNSIGGTWAENRLFPGLKTNNLLGMYEHPDLPLYESKIGVEKGKHIPGRKMLEYLDMFKHENGLHNQIRRGTKVEVVTKETDGWKLHCKSYASDGASYSKLDITAKKLIIAVGNTNKPKMPKHTTSPSFEPKVIHSKDFAVNYEDIVKPSKHTLVIGGGKSAFDVAYACATQPDATVTLLIRPSGNGPNWVAPTHVTPFKLWLEKLVFTRFFGFMSPCPWAQTSGLEGWLRSFLHGTWLGRKVITAFWKILGDDAIALNKLNDHPETQKLVPWRGAFEVSNCLSIHNYPTNFFDMVREGRVKVVIDEVQSFEAGKDVVLRSGGKLQVDAVVCATGWEVANTIRFEPESLEKDLGLPSKEPLTTTEANLIHKTESDLLTRFPILNRDTSRTNHPDPSLRTTQTPMTKTPNTTQQPYRLHRFIVPPAFLNDRSIAFSGAMFCLGSYPLAYIQSLWITAYFDNKLSLPFPPPEQVIEDTYRDTQYFVLRTAGGYGRTAPDVVFDTLPYFDMLLRDLGLNGRRKGGGVREVVSSYGPEDYRGLIEEWVRKERREEGKKDI